jgi:uncharacterized protein (DUF302 family)
VTTRQVNVQRFSVVSSKQFEEVVKSIEAAVGHPDMSAFHRDVIAANTAQALENVVQGVVGPSDLMEFTRFDVGEILRKYQGKKARRSLRLLIGNPLIMKKMVDHVPDAASYAPVTILIDERADGVHVSYDRMASLLSPYDNAEAFNVARDLDANVEALLVASAG